VELLELEPPELELELVMLELELVLLAAADDAPELLETAELLECPVELADAMLALKLEATEPVVITPEEEEEAELL
jgi:hypothetical protein